MTAINRPLTDEERIYLNTIARAHLAEEFGGSLQRADAVLAKLVADGEVVIRGDAENVYYEAGGRLLVHCARDWLAFFAAHPDQDPMLHRRISRPGLN